MNNKELLKEFEEKFKESQKELGFQTSLEDLDSVFFLRDFILSSRFVSTQVSRQISSRIVDAFSNWINYLNNLLMPNPGFLSFQTEAKIFSSEEDRKLVWELIKNSSKLTSMNAVVVTNGDKVLERDFIDKSYSYWKNEFKPSLEKIMKRISEAWNKD